MKKLQAKELEINDRFNELTSVVGENRITMQEAMIKIADDYRVNVLTIRQYITKENLKKAKNRLTKPQQIVYNMLKRGETQSKIARELKVSRQNVGYMLNTIKKKGYEIDIIKFKRD